MGGESVTMTFNMTVLNIKIADVLCFSKMPISCRGARSTGMHEKRVLQAEVISMWARAGHSAYLWCRDQHGTSRGRIPCLMTIVLELKFADNTVRCSMSDEEPTQRQRNGEEPQRTVADLGINTPLLNMS